jgi:hypothetical protein
METAIAVVWGLLFSVMGFIFWVYVRRIIRLKQRSRGTVGLLFLGAACFLTAAVLVFDSGARIHLKIEPRLAFAASLLIWVYGFCSLSKGINGTQIGLKATEARIVMAAGCGGLIFGALLAAYYLLWPT